MSQAHPEEFFWTNLLGDIFVGARLSSEAPLYFIH